MPDIIRQSDVLHVADEIYFVSGSNTNWVIVKEGDDATLIDTGYPGDWNALLSSLATVGVRPQAITAILITHAHTDHIGCAERFHNSHGAPVLMHEEEVPHARRDFLDQVSLSKVLGNIWRPGVIPWAVHALRAGGTARVPVTKPVPFPVAGMLDLPGSPVPIHTPGHTRGHVSYHLPNSGVFVSGDALVTAHPTSRISGPQLLPGMFHSQRSSAISALSTLQNIDADIVLPGHGPVHRGPLAHAATRAQELAGAGS